MTNKEYNECIEDILKAKMSKDDSRKALLSFMKILNVSEIYYKDYLAIGLSLLGLYGPKDSDLTKKVTSVKSHRSFNKMYYKMCIVVDKLSDEGTMNMATNIQQSTWVYMSMLFVILFYYFKNTKFPEGFEDILTINSQYHTDLEV